MSWHSLGKITCTTAGTNYHITTNETDEDARIPCFSVTFQNIVGNTGVFYVFDRAAGSATTGTGWVATVPAVISNTSVPSYTVSIPQSPASLNAADFYVTSSVNGEAVLVSYTKV